MNTYLINIKTLKINEVKQKTFYNKTQEMKFEANDKKHCANLFVQYCIDNKLAHKTFNTTAKKDVVQFIMNKQ